MTGKQLKKMLSFEGLYYAAGTVVASIVFGSLVSVIIVRAISNSIWFFTYKFVIFPMFVIYPFFDCANGYYSGNHISKDRKNKYYRTASSKLNNIEKLEAKLSLLPAFLYLLLYVVD